MVRFSFKNFKSTEHCLSINGLSIAMWAGLPDPKAQTHKHDSKPEKK
jgi:hypothetical protein